MQMVTLNRQVPQGVSLGLPCPNCGKHLEAYLTVPQFSCPGCREELVWSTDGTKLLLSKPLSTYLDTGNQVAEIAAIWDRADRAEALIDLRRRQATVEMATRWIGERIALGKRYFKIGLGLSLLSIVLLSVAFIRILLAGNIYLDAFIPFILASLIIPFGFFFFVWSMVDRFTMGKYIQRTQEERRILIEEEQTLRN